MYTAADFRKAYEDYIQFNKELKANIGPMQGIIGVLGFGPKPGNDPGHGEFLKEMKTVLDQVCAESPDSVTADSIMDVIFRARETYEDENLSPYIFSAVEGLTINLIPFISLEKAQELYTQQKHIPMSLRVPVRKQLLAALSARLGK